MTTTHAAAPVRPEAATDRAERNLRRVLALDAAVGSFTAAGFLATTDLYHRVTGLSADLLHVAAFVLLGYAVVLTWATVRRPLRRRTVGGLVVANWVYAAACVVVAATVEATALGVAYVLGQALVVVAFAVSEARYLRRVRH